MLESKFQSKVIKALECRGWMVVKNISTNKNGWPDLTAYHPRYPTLFIEVKGPKTPLEPLQQYRINKLREIGQKVRVFRAK